MKKYNFQKAFIDTNIVSPLEFLKLAESSKHIIVKSRFIIPEIGDDDFGSFEVKIKRKSIYEKREFTTA